MGHIVSHEGVKVDPKKKIHDGLANSQNPEESSRIIRNDRVLPQVFLELWNNSNPCNSVTKERCILLDSRGNSSFSTTQRGHV